MNTNASNTDKIELFVLNTHLSVHCTVWIKTYFLGVAQLSGTNLQPAQHFII